MAGFYNTLENISDNIDYFIDDVVWRYNYLGMESLVLKFLPLSKAKLLFRLRLDLMWSEEEAESLLQHIDDKKWPEAVYNIEAAKYAVAIYTEAYNKRKYFWMRKI